MAKINFERIYSIRFSALEKTTPYNVESTTIEYTTGSTTTTGYNVVTTPPPYTENQGYHTSPKPLKYVITTEEEYTTHEQTTTETDSSLEMTYTPTVGRKKAPTHSTPKLTS